MTYIMVNTWGVPTMRIAIAEAKAQFSELVRRAEAGEAIELTRYGRAVARLTAVKSTPKQSLIGAMEGAFTVPDDLNEGDTEIEVLFEKSVTD